MSAVVDENVAPKALPTRFHSSRVPKYISERLEKSLGRSGSDSAESQKHERESIRTSQSAQDKSPSSEIQGQENVESAEGTPKRPQNNGDERLTPLSDKVERFRKGKGPSKKVRCSSYYDDGMLQSTLC